MATPQPVAELPEVLSLASKLFAQCKDRDAPSAFKLLAPSVRGLRNTLEEVEEVWDPSRTLGPDDIRLLDQICRGNETLGQLDLVLQPHKRSERGEVDTHAVSDLKTALDVTKHQLSLAFEATTTGEIPLKLDTGGFPDCNAAAGSVEDSSVSQSRQSSTWSLDQKATPQSPGTSDATSIHNERADRPPSEEKQAMSPHVRRPSAAHGPVDWRSPFADPMSMGFEAATAFILGEDDDQSLGASARPQWRPRAASNVSAATETFVSAPGSPDAERKPSTPRMEKGMDSKPLPQSPGEDDQEERGLVEPETAPKGNIPEQTKAEETYLRPETATRDVSLGRSRSGSNGSVTSDTKTVGKSVPSDGASETSSPGETADLPVEQSAATPDKVEPQEQHLEATTDAATNFSSHSIPSPAPSASNKPWLASTEAVSCETRTTSQEDTVPGAEEGGFAEELSKSIETAFERRTSDAEPLALSAAVISSSPTPDTNSFPVVAGPAVPSRRPPPPPPPPPKRRRSRSKTNIRLETTRSRYRIVNDNPDDSSSDDELYATSRPTSAVEAKLSPSAQSPPVSTPTIQIDQSALDEEPKSDEAEAGPGGQAEDDSTTAAGPPLRQVPERPTNASPPFIPTESPTAAKSQETQRATQSSPKISEAQRTSQSPRSPKPSQSPSLPPSAQRRINAAVQAGDKLLASEVFARQQREEKPPPVPPRPSASRYNRPRAATSVPTSAATSEKEIARESGLEVNDRLLASKPTHTRLVSRISIDQALNVASRNQALAPEVIPCSEGSRHTRSASTSQLPPPQLPYRSSQSSLSSSGAGRPLTGWYAPGTDDTSQSKLDGERVEHVVHFCNTMAWDSAEAYLMAYLESLIEQNQAALARRIRHLLAVCATYKGEHQRAIDLFLNVLEIKEVADLSKPGNCEACYWLGDLYAMQNQRTESLLAYYAAQWGTLFNDPMEPRLRELVKAEQEAVRLGDSKADLLARCTKEANRGCGSILDPRILPLPVVYYLFGHEPPSGTTGPHGHFQLDRNKPRSSSFFSVSTSPQAGKFRQHKIWPQNFLLHGPWPMQFDPTFTMANVQQERLLLYEADLLDLLQNRNGEAKLPRTGPMSVSRTDCFTCSDLVWLITAVRSCLEMMEMEWSEVANEQGAWFVVRHSVMDGTDKGAKMKIATVHYFAISIFRQSFRHSYGVEICSHGVSSARIMDPSNLDCEKGVHWIEAKRIKRLIREALEEAEKKRHKVKKRSSFGFGVSRSSSDDQPVRVA